MMNEIERQYQDKYEDHIEKLNNPKIKIVGITQECKKS